MCPGGVEPPPYRASRAASVPASGPPGPQPSGSQRVRGGQPTPSDAGLRPTLSQASFTAPQRPPVYLARPRPAPPTLGAAALANTSVPRSLVTQAHRPSVPQAHRPSVPQAHRPSVPPAPGLATSVQASGLPGSQTELVPADPCPALGQAPSTAPQRPPKYLSRPRPAPPPLGAAALANTSGPSSSVTQAHRPSVPQAHRPSVPQAHGPSVNPPPRPGNQRPSQRPQGSQAERVPADPCPALGQAPSTAPQRPPGYRSRPRPAPHPLGAAALANTVFCQHRTRFTTGVDLGTQPLSWNPLR